MAKLEKKKSFTLIEIMITVVILLIVLGSMLYTFTHCMLLNEQNSNLVTALNDGQLVLEEIKALAFDDIKTYGPPPVFTNLGSEAVNVDCNGAACGSLPNGVQIILIDVTVSWTERQRPRSVLLSTSIARSV